MKAYVATQVCTLIYNQRDSISHNKMEFILLKYELSVISELCRIRVIYKGWSQS